MASFGLIGFPLKNSFSKDFFFEKFRTLQLSDYTYQNFPIEDIAQLKEILSKNPDIKGFNVTIPHKENILSWLDDIDESAKVVGAVNCVKVIDLNNVISASLNDHVSASLNDQQLSTINSSQFTVHSKIKTVNRESSTTKHQLIGYNTDVYGFEQSLKNFIPNIESIKHAIVLGNGGAAKAVKYVLKKNNIAYTIVSRQQTNDAILYNEINKELVEKSQLIINCTPVGMYPNINYCVDFPFEFLTPNHYCFDLIYLPEETSFLTHAKQHGAQTKNGLEMLHLQAEKSWEIWNQ